MNIGDKVRDTVSGFRGTITAETTWQGGRQTFHVQPSVGLDGSFREGKWIEAALLEIDDTPIPYGYGDSQRRTIVGLKES